MKKWEFYVNRKFNYFIEWVQTICTQSKWQKEGLGFSFPLKNYLILNGNEYFHLKEAEDYEKFLEKQSKKDKNFFDNFIKSEIKLINEAKSLEKFLKEKPFSLSKLSDKDLNLIFKKFLRTHIKCFATAFVRPDAYLERKVKEELTSFLKDLKEKDIEELFKYIATYPKEEARKLDYLEEPLNLLKIANLIKKKGLQRKLSTKNLPLDISKKIEKHWQRYRWLKNPIVYQNLSISKKEMFERLKNLLETDIEEKIKYIIQERSKNEKNFSNIIRKFNFPHELINLCRILRKFIFLRTYTTEGTDRLFYWARQTILKEIAKRMKLNDEDIVTLTSKEIIDFLERKKKISSKIIKERKRIFAVIWQDKKAKMYFGKEAEKIIKKYKKIELRVRKRKLKIKIVKGAIAAPGIAKGKAKILESFKEVGKVKKGDILIVSMTTPDYIAAMEKASAFVTDEGGITCHAAIIAREMNKPCVIGTKIATKIFRNGDLIEVDANKGIVRKLIKNRSYAPLKWC